MDQIPVRPSNDIHTVHATNVLGFVDGGSFVLYFYEQRSVTECAFPNMFDAGHLAMVEVARVSLSQSAIQILREQINRIVDIHEASAGKLVGVGEYEEKATNYLLRLIATQGAASNNGTSKT